MPTRQLLIPIFVLCFLIAPFFAWSQTCDTVLIRLYKNGLYGYTDSATKKTVVAPKFNDAGYFYEGIARVKATETWGYINKSGKLVVPFKYENAADFKDGLARVQLSDKWGYIDYSGKEVIPCKYDIALNFANDKADVKYNEKWGYINKSGVEIIPVIYDDPIVFSEGLADVSLNHKCGYIDSTGKEIIPFIYDNAYAFYGGLAHVVKYNKSGFIDKTGKLIVQLKYDDAENFSVYTGIARVKLLGKYGFIDKTGSEIIPAIYDWTSSNYDRPGSIKAELNGVTECFDLSGKDYRQHILKVAKASIYKAMYPQYDMDWIRSKTALCDSDCHKAITKILFHIVEYIKPGDTIIIDDCNIRSGNLYNFYSCANPGANVNVCVIPQDVSNFFWFVKDTAGTYAQIKEKYHLSGRDWERIKKSIQLTPDTGATWKVSCRISKRVGEPVYDSSQNLGKFMCPVDVKASDVALIITRPVSPSDKGNTDPTPVDIVIMVGPCLRHLLHD